ncbi:MAG: hypothetical protein LWX83_13560 [Anaerolineae bacterium]|nr:hypothetical protein [Anaerolineae bacterium]
MKLSSDKLEKVGSVLQVNDWQPVDFLNEISAGPLPRDNRKKTEENVPEPSRVIKLSIADAERYKKVLDAGNTPAETAAWEPIDFNAEVELPLEEIIEADADIPDEAVEDILMHPTEEELRYQAEMLAEIEQKQAEAAAALEEAQKQAQDLLSQAREEAAHLVSQAHDQAEQIKQTAYDEGASRAKLESEEQLQHVTAIIKETQDWRQKILDQSEDVLIKMLQSIARKLFGNGYVLDANSIEEMIGRAITEANRLGNLRVYVNPDDHGVILSVWQESDLVVNGQKIQLIPSQNILRGGCFVEGEFGVVDSRIEVQLEILESELNRTFNTREQEKQRQADLADDFTVEERDLPMPDLASLEQVQAMETLPEDNIDIENNLSTVDETEVEENVLENDSQSE